MKYNHLIYALSIGLFPNLLQTESTNFNDLHILAQALEPINKNLEHNKNMILSDTYIPLYILDENGNSLSESPSYYLSTEEMLPTRACTPTTSYQLVLPSAEGLQGQVLGLADNAGTLTWLTTLTNSNQLNFIYTATSCDKPLTLILRDSTGSFAATTITLTGNSLINYSSVGGCDTGSGFVFAPTHQNTIIGLNAGNNNTLTGTSNVALGFNALMTATVACDNVAIGVNSAQTLQGGAQFTYYNYLDNQITAIGGAENVAIGINALATTTQGFGNVALGSGALSNAVDIAAGGVYGPLVFNVAVGYQTLANTQAGIIGGHGGFSPFINTAVGSFALTNNSTGENNTAIGNNAMAANLHGNGNIALGYSALNLTQNPTTDIAIGNSALQNDNGLGSNIAIGYEAMQSASPSNGFDIALGNGALAKDVGGQNLALGHSALGNVLTGVNNIALGLNAGYPYTSNESNNILISSGGAPGDQNTIRIGTQGTQTSAYVAGIYGTPVTGSPVVVTSLGQLGVGTSSTATGTSCNSALTLVLRDSTGSFAATTITLTGNSLINYSSVGGCDTGSGFVFAPTHQNTIIGLNAGNNNTLTGTSNVALGFNALMTATVACDNVAIGANSAQTLQGGAQFTYYNYLDNQITAIGGAENVAIGVNALATTTHGFGNVALGSGALSNAVDIAAGGVYGPLVFNVAVGYQTLANTQAGIIGGHGGFSPFINTAVGSFALTNNSTGENNTAIGNNAMAANLHGNGNIALGYSALNLTQNPTTDIAIGNSALQNDNGLGSNIAIGYEAMQSASPSNGFDIALGNGALAKDVGGQNLALGHSALGNVLTGVNNIALGLNAGYPYTSNESNNILISSGGAPGDQNTIRIGTQGTQTSAYVAGIYGTPVTGSPVVVTSLGQLGVGTITTTSFTGQLYGDVIGTQTATHVAFVCGIPACALAQTYSTVLSATSADIPLTLVLRDSTGSFAATTVTVTTVAFEAKDNSGTVSITGPATVSTSYGVTLPQAQGNSSQTLINDGFGNLSWQTVVIGSAIESLNSVTVVNQFLTTYTAETFFGWTDNAVTGVHQLDIPYAGNLPDDNNHVGLITGEDYQNFEFAYNGVYNATPLDIQGTIVERDSTGSFAATNITVTGYQVFEGSTGAGSVSLTAGNLTNTYTLILPAAQATGPNQALFNNGSGQLSWVATLTGGIESLNGLTAPEQFLTTNTGNLTLVVWNDIEPGTHELNIPYAGNLIGTTSVGLISGIDYQNFEFAYNGVYNATPLDIQGTIVERDSTGSFAATNITVTGYQVFQGSTGAGSVSLTAGNLTNTYTLILPAAQATGPNQALFNNGSGQLSWVATLTGGIESLNGLTAPEQFLTTNTGNLTLVVWNDIEPGTHELNIPYAGNLIGTTSVGLISGIDYQNFEFAYNGVYNATPLDIQGTIVERDSTGSFAATNITVTGYQVFQGSTGAGSVSLTAGNLTNTYTLILPTNAAPGLYQVLGVVSGPGKTEQLGWITTVTNSTELNWIYTATSADIPNTLVLRDNTGSFAAYNITADGCLTVNDPTLSPAGQICGSISALTVAPQGSRALQASASGNTRGTYAVDLQINASGSDVASGSYAVIAGGQSNTASNSYAAILGGQNNTASNSYGIVVGGSYNNSTGNSSFVGNGEHHTASGDYSSVTGGYENTASGNYAVVGGGQYNHASNTNAAILGGQSNTASNTYGVVVGGFGNNAAGNSSFIGGGIGNSNTTGDQAVIVGGEGNSASNTFATVVGGSANTASNTYGIVVGGFNNKAAGNSSFIGGGQNHNATDDYATVVGGYQNKASNYYAVVGGGNYNTASGNSSFVGAGYTNTANSDYSVITGGYYNNASNYYAVVGGGTYNTASGNSSFVGAGYTNTANSDYSVVVGGQNNTLGSSLGNWSIIGGGLSNNLNGYYAVITGGYNNSTSSSYATVGGGQNNSAGYAGTVGGGNGNAAGGQYATVPGGYNNQANGEYSVALGQQANAANNGAFVFADSQGSSFASTSNDTFNIRAQSGLVFQGNSTGNITFTVPSSFSSSYGLILPTSHGANGQVLSTNGGAPAQLSWITTVTNSAQLNLLNTATSCDNASTLVLRDSTGSFAATTITLTGNSLINYSTVGGCNTGAGFVFAPTKGNTIIGLNAGNNNINITGTGNLALGFNALALNTSGSNNTALGFGTLATNVNKSNNVAIGTQAMASANPLSGNSVAIGYQALAHDSFGYNVAVGSQALSANLSPYNAAVGTFALQANTTGNFNTALGFNALTTNTTGVQNTGIGASALNNNIGGSYNTAVGTNALLDLTTGQYNTAVGVNAIELITSGNSNVALGYAAGQNAGSNTSNSIYISNLGNSTDNNVTYIGTQGTQTAAYVAGIYNTLLVGEPVVVTSSGRLGVGTYSDLINTATSCDNILSLVLRDSTGSFAATTITLTGNSLINYSTIGGCNTGQGFVFAPTNQNTLIGLNAGNNNILTGTSNVALGFDALASITAGFDNIAIGAFAGQSLIGGEGENNSYIFNGAADNIAIGTGALASTQQGFSNVAIGTSALMTGTDLVVNGGIFAGTYPMQYNVAIGYQASMNAIAYQFFGDSIFDPRPEPIINTAIGSFALTNNISGNYNTAVGNNALSANVIGSYNTAEGYSALSANVLGGSNTAVGYSALLTVTSGSNNTALGTGADVGEPAQNRTAIGAGAAAFVDNSVMLGNSSVRYIMPSGTINSTNLGYAPNNLFNNVLAKQFNIYDSGNTNYAGITAPSATYAFTYTLQMPINQGAFGQLLTTDGNNPAQLSWSTLPTYTLLTAATACDTPSTLVLRDNTGTFEATTVALSGKSLINYSSLGGCNTGQGFIFAPTHNNTIIGLNAGNNNTLTGSGNIAIGQNALQLIATGTSNIAIGYNALQLNSSGHDNIGIGLNALQNNTGPYQIALGTNALQNNTGTNNFAAGYYALANNTAGQFNTAIGDYSLQNNTVGSSNIGIGISTLANSNSGDNIAIGIYSLTNNTQGQQQVAIGSRALQSNITGTSNVGIGYYSLYYNNSGYANTALGYYAGLNCLTGSNNIYLGANVVGSAGDNNLIKIGNGQTQTYVAGIYNNLQVGEPVVITSNGQLGVGSYSNLINTATSCDNALALVLRDSTGSFAATTITLTGNSLINYSSVGGCDTGAGFVWAPTKQNTLIGLGAGNSNNLTGTSNVALGYQALANNITGYNNTALGFGTLATNTNKSNNVAIGTNAMASANPYFGNSVAIGYQALAHDSSGYNVAVGSQALSANTTGYDNTAVGTFALQDNNSGLGNSAFGAFALSANTSGGSNTAIGTLALNANMIGNYNTAVGSQAMYATTAGYYNTALGINAMNSAQASHDVAIGYNSLGLDSAGFNVAVGEATLSNIITGTYNVALGYEAGVNAGTSTSNSIYIANQGNSTDSNVTYIGTQGTQTAAYVAGIYNNLQVGEPVVVTSSGQLGIGSYSNLINTATSCDTALTLILRDSTGSFEATTVTLTGNSLINYSSVGGCNIGQGFVFAPTYGNTIIGLNAGNNNTLTGTLNVALGNQALNANTTGKNNTAVGYQAAKSNMTSSDNVALGNNALATFNGAIGQNVAIGSGAMQNATPLNAAASDIAIGYSALQKDNGQGANIAIGSLAMQNATPINGQDIAIGALTLPSDTIGFNIAIGFSSMTNNTTGVNNVAMGISSLGTNTSGSYNVALGTSALFGNGASAAKNVSNNVGVGYQSLYSNRANNLTAVGYYALGSNTTGIQNTALGYNALGSNTTGTSNVALGYQALANAAGINNFDNIAIGANTLSGASILGDNIAVGTNALSASGYTGGQQIAIGTGALQANTTGTGNIAIGYDALQTNTSGVNNIAIGAYALSKLNYNLPFLGIPSGANNIAIGSNALSNIIQAGENVAIGSNTLQNGSFSYGNVAIGYNAFVFGNSAFNVAVGNSSMGSNNTGASNTAVGYYSLSGNTTGNSNTAIGSYSLSGNIIGFNNTAVGYNALLTASVGNALTAVGSGALQYNTLGTQNVGVGYSTLQSNTSGSNNTAVGFNALSLSQFSNNNTAIGNLTLNNAAVGSDNTAVGNQALSTNQTSSLVGIGSGALFNNTTGAQNVAVGYYALNANITGFNNTALGYQALANANTANNFDNIAIGANTLSGASILGDNIAIGYNALSSANYTKGQQTAIGTGVLQFNTTGTANVGIGYQVLDANTIGSNNVALGNEALTINISGNDNTAIGTNALANSTASRLTAVGSGALANATTGIQNTAVGFNALNLNTTGTSNIAIGYQALANARTINNFDNIAIGAFTLTGTAVLGDNIAIGYNALSSANYNKGQQIAIGTGALQNNTSGVQNHAEGYYALNANTTGTSNVAIGYQALANAKTINNFDNIAIGAFALSGASILGDNIAIGYNALSSANYTGGQQTGIGTGVLQFNTTGTANVGIGYQVLDANTIGSNNVALGNEALTINISGNDNTAIGTNALANSTASQLTAVGSGALANATTGIQNTAVGYYALNANTTGTSNVAIGHQTLAANTASVNNVAVGCYALTKLSGTITYGGNNTAIGADALAALTTGTNNVAIGYNAGTNLLTGTGNIYIGANVYAGAITTSTAESDTIRIGALYGAGSGACYIQGIFGQTYTTGGAAVSIGSNGKLGTTASTRRVKKNIQDMDNITEDLHKLRPVTFNYIWDGYEDHLEYGLIAEEVEEIYPGIVIKDAYGQPQTVQYQYIPLMMLNELQKDRAMLLDYRKRLETLEICYKETIATMQEQIADLQTKIEKLVA